MNECFSRYVNNIVSFSACGTNAKVRIIEGKREREGGRDDTVSHPKKADYKRLYQLLAGWIYNKIDIVNGPISVCVSRSYFNEAPSHYAGPVAN